MTTKAKRATESLQESLDIFAASNRFGFLRALQVGRILGEENTFGPLNELTCDRLVELGAERVRSSYRLSAQQVERLAELVMALGNGHPAESAPAASLQDSCRAADGSSAVPLFNSVQVELDLRAKLDEVRGHPRFSLFRSQTLGQFWEPSWPRAPFEEALTIHQLVEMDLALLFKKRSTSGARAHYVTRALGKVLAEHAPQGAAVSAPVHQKIGSSPAWNLRGTAHPWLAEASEMTESTPAELAMLEVFMAATAGNNEGTGSLLSVMASLPSFLTAREFLSALGEQQAPPRVVSQLSKWLKECGEASCIGLIREALQTPGCRVEFLAKIVDETGRYSAFSGIAATVLARALRAEQVRYGDKMCPGMWSLNPGLISLIINEAKRRKSRDVVRAVKELCPAMDPFLQKWICEVVGSVSPRKPKRKGR